MYRYIRNCLMYHRTCHIYTHLRSLFIFLQQLFTLDFTLTLIDSIFNNLWSIWILLCLRFLWKPEKNIYMFFNIYNTSPSIYAHDWILKILRKRNTILLSIALYAEESISQPTCLYQSQLVSLIDQFNEDNCEILVCSYILWLYISIYSREVYIHCWLSVS
jgi:hypothetical protein